MRRIPELLAGALLSAACACSAAAQSAQRSLSAPAAASADAPGYSSSEADFVVGKSVYLRSTKTPIGRIWAVDDDKSFPRGFPRSHMKAVLIRRVDGPWSWVPVEGITRIYVSR